MSEAMIQFTVRCPNCGAKSRMRHNISAIAEAFMLDNPIRLHAACHDVWWDASFLERRQLRQCLIELSPPPGEGAPSRSATL